MRDVGEVLGSALGVLGAGERFERFELADADAVPRLQLALESLVNDGMPGQEIAPLLGRLPLAVRVHAGHRSMHSHLMLLH
ncbi:hypothetical protein [Streptomyces sp. NPDC004546]|uniref:hypothetical protein n=1 Tax=Streptomyces sp. NPDC004546 TaxID=3154282 RepID=UPI0033A782A6